MNSLAVITSVTVSPVVAVLVVLFCAQSSAESGSARIGRITIPADATPGQQIIVMTTVGVQFTVVVPNYAKPGQKMEIALPDGFGSVSEHAFVDARAGQVGAVTGGGGQSLGGGVSSSSASPSEALDVDENGNPAFYEYDGDEYAEAADYEEGRLRNESALGGISMWSAQRYTAGMDELTRMLGRMPPPGAGGGTR